MSVAGTFHSFCIGRYPYYIHKYGQGKSIYMALQSWTGLRTVDIDFATNLHGFSRLIKANPCKSVKSAIKFSHRHENLPRTIHRVRAVSGFLFQKNLSKLMNISIKVYFDVVPVQQLNQLLLMFDAPGSHAFKVVLEYFTHQVWECSRSSVIT